VIGLVLVVGIGIAVLAVGLAVGMLVAGRLTRWMDRADEETDDR
jgi:hypothetical protein